jgi:hypothetical protein
MGSSSFEMQRYPMHGNSKFLPRLPVCCGSQSSEREDTTARLIRKLVPPLGLDFQGTACYSLRSATSSRRCARGTAEQMAGEAKGVRVQAA